MDQINISIITVVLNDLEGLIRTYNSVSTQAGIPHEWIVCDGGSGIETTNFLSSLSNSVKWISRQDNGIYDAMNYGVSMSSGNYIVFMNAGDTFYDSQSLANVAQLLSDRHINSDIVFGGAVLNFMHDRNMVYRPPRRVEKSIWHGLPANHQATYYRKALLDQTPYDLQYSLCGDYYLAAKLVNNGATFTYVDMPLAIFEVGGMSYKSRKKLFLEPYRIQRDVLGLPIFWRLTSIGKRLISTIGFVLLSNSTLYKAMSILGLVQRSKVISN